MLNWLKKRNNSVIYDWIKLDQKVFFKELVEEWTKMLSDTNLLEKDYHNFLANYAGLFLADKARTYLVLNKLQFGNDYVSDFVVINENFSAGLYYNIIEIETPHCNLFTKKGNQSARLNQAIQQILDWKRWLENNPDNVGKILPNVNRAIKPPNYNFTIYIGNRNISNEHTIKRNQLSQELGINIRSFDNLTDNLLMTLFMSRLTTPFLDMDKQVSEIKTNEFINPFFKATSFSKWKEICKEGEWTQTQHFYYYNLDRILKTREYNDYLDKFKKKYKKLSRKQ